MPAHDRAGYTGLECCQSLMEQGQDIPMDSDNEEVFEAGSLGRKEMTRDEVTIMNEIPIMKLVADWSPRMLAGHACASLCRFILALSLPWLLVALVFWWESAEYQVAFGPTDSLLLDLEKCDLRIRLDPGRQEGGLATVRTWNLMGAGGVHDDPGRKELRLKNDRLSTFFSCQANLWLADLSADAHHLKALTLRSVGQDTNRVVVENAGDSNPRLAVADSANFTVTHGLMALTKLRVGGSATFAFLGGQVSLVEPEVGSGLLAIDTEHGTTVHVRTSKAATVSLSEAQERNVCGAEVEAPAASARRRLREGAGLRIEVTGSTESPVYVSARGGGASCDAGQGRPELSPFAKGLPLQRLKQFLEPADTKPSIAYVQLVCPSCPEGHWLILSSKAFLALSMDWFVLLTSWVTYPHNLELDLAVLGELGHDAMERLELLEDSVGVERLAPWTVLWVPAGDAPRLLLERTPGSHRGLLRPVQLADWALPLLAILISIIAAVSAALYISQLWMRIIAPAVAERVATIQVADCATQRLLYTKRIESWWIFACAVEYPCHGVLLRWRIRPEHRQAVSFGIQIKCEAEGRLPASVESLHVPKFKISPARNSPNMQEYVVRSELAGGHLVPGRAYTFMLRPMSSTGKPVGNVSAWTAVVRLPYPSPFTDLPLVMLKTFLPAPVSSLAVFMDQVKRKQLELRIRLQNLEIDFMKVAYDELDKSGEDCVLEIGWPANASEEDMERWDRVDENDPRIAKIPLDLCDPGWRDREGRHASGLSQDRARTKFTYALSRKLELMMTTESEKQVVLKLKTCDSLREIFQTSVSVSELFKQWEKQVEAVKVKGEQRVEDFERQIGDPKCDTRFERGLDHFSLRFSMVFETRDEQGTWWPMYCPMTPYLGGDITTGRTARERRLQRSQNWVKSPFRSIMPSEMVTQGSRKIVTWDKKAMQEALGLPGEDSKFDIHLRQASACRDSAEKVRPIAKGVPVSAGKVTWKVPLNESVDGRFVLVGVSQGSLSPASVEFFVDMPLTVQTFEMAYGAFCRSHQLPMEMCTEEKLNESGLKLLTMQLAVCQGLRPILPVENSLAEGKELKACRFPNAQLPHNRAIRLVRSLGPPGQHHRSSMRRSSEATPEPQSDVRKDVEPDFEYRSAVNEVTVLEGVSWRTGEADRPGPADVWLRDKLLRYQLDMSWWLTERLAHKYLRRRGPGPRVSVATLLQQPYWFIVRRLIYGLQETLVFLLQIVLFNAVPTCMLAAVFSHEYLQSELNPSFNHGASFWGVASDGAHVGEMLADFWLNSPLTGLLPQQHAHARRPTGSQEAHIQMAFLALCVYYALIAGCLLYMNFLREYGSARLYGRVDSVARWTAGVSAFGFFVFVNMCVLWLLMACLMISPETLMPVAVMVLSASSATLFMVRYLMSISVEMHDVMVSLVDRLLKNCVTEFIDSRPELKQAEKGVDDLFYYETSWVWDKKAEDFELALAELGQKIPKPSPGADEGGAERAEEEGVDLEEELEDGGDEGNHGKDLDTEYTLSAETRKKLDTCFHYMVNKIPLPAGLEQSIRQTQRLAASAIQRRDDALSNLLERGRSSCLEILQGNITRNLKFGLASVLHAGPDSRINVLDEEKTAQDAVLFYDKTLMELIRTHVRARIREKYVYILECAKLRVPTKGYRFVKMNDGVEDEPKGISVEGEDLQNELLPRLQSLGLIGPRDLAALQGGKGADELRAKVQQVTSGEPRMQREHLVKLLRRMMDTQGDGHVDHIWYSAYRDFLEELYLCPKRELVEMRREDNHEMKVEWKMGEGALEMMVPIGSDGVLQITDPGKAQLGSEQDKKGWIIEYLSYRDSKGVRKYHAGMELKDLFGQTDKRFPQDHPFLTHEGADTVLLITPWLHHVQPNKPSMAETCNWGFPISLPQLQEAWDEETGDDLTMDLDRIEDVILTKLLMDRQTNIRQLWVEAFVLLARSLHVWPEVPFEDAHVEISEVWVKGEPKTVATKTKEWRDRHKFNFGDAEFHGKREPTILNCWSQEGDISYFSWVGRADGQVQKMATLGRRKEASDIRPEPLNAYAGAKFSVGFKDLGSFTPANGFGFVQTSWEALSESGDRPWIKLEWDQDAQDNPKSPPFEGSLTVFLVFLNLNPDEGEKELHRDRPWVLDQNWKLEENLELPILAAQARAQAAPKWRNFEQPAWARDSPSFVQPRHEVRSKIFYPEVGELKNFATLHGFGERLGEQKPVLIFVRYTRKALPDMNSFDDAHLAPFRRSDFFYQLWQDAEGEAARRAARNESEWKKVTWRVNITDAEALLRNLVMEKVDPKDPSALKSLCSIGEGLYWDDGKNNAGVSTVWHKKHGLESGCWSRMRGLWFDAFEELLVHIGLEMDTESAWNIFQRLLSSKKAPMVGFNGKFAPRWRPDGTWDGDEEPGGLVPISMDGTRPEDAETEFVGIVNALKYMQIKQPFMSDGTFLEFNELSGLHMDETIAKRLFSHISKKTPKYQGASGLVHWHDIADKFREHVARKSHPIHVRLHGDREPTSFRVGGIWFEPLYNVVITSMPEVPDWAEVKEIYESMVDRRTGLCPLAKVYDVLAKLGRPGLKFEQFRSFITRLGMHVHPTMLRQCFQTVDVEQNNTLDAAELKTGMNLLFRQLVPMLILRQHSLLPEQIIFHVSCSLGILLLIFAFLQLSFTALVGEGGGSQLSSTLQSILAASAAFVTARRQGIIYNQKELYHTVSQNMQQTAGVVLEETGADGG